MINLISQKSRSTKKKPGYGKPIEDTEGYLGTEDLRPEAELISEPICFTGHAFEQHINWDDRDKAV